MKFATGATLLLFASLAPAQSTPDAIKLGDVTFSATLRMRAYAWDWFEPAANYQNEYGYSANLLRLNFAETRGALDLDAEIAVPFFLDMPDRAMAPAPQGALGLGSNYYSASGNHQYSAMVFPKQLYARYHFGPHESSSIQAGRMEFNDGTEITPRNATLATLKRDRISQRLIGTFGFSDVGRSFDGLRYSWTTPKADFTFLAVTPTRGVFQTDGWGWNRVGLGYAAFTKEWGSARHAADTRFFVIDYDDFRPELKTDNRSLNIRKTDTENIQMQTWGGHSIHAFTTSAGTLDAVGWLAFQTGRWGTQTQRAYAFDVESGFQPAILSRLRPWIRGGYNFASGDGNPNDARHETFFQILPTPRIYARFPFFTMMNMQDAFGTLILRPHPKVTIQSQFDSLRLSSVNDLWYSGGGVFQPWTFGYTGRSTSGAGSLANVYDTGLEYRVNRHTTLTAYFGYAQGLAAMKSIYPADKDGRFGYFEALFRM